MSNSARVTARHPLSAMMAVVAIVALLTGGTSFLVTNGATASGVDVGASASSATATASSTASPTATATTTPTAEPTKSAFPKAQGWAHQPNGVKFRITKKGYAYFWTTDDPGWGVVTWNTLNVLRNKAGAVEVRHYDAGPKRVKFKKCGVKTRVTIYGFQSAQDRVLPAWPCKYAKKK